MSALATARHRLALARELCAHWDYESDGEGHECCDEVRTVRNALDTARRRATPNDG